MSHTAFFYGTLMAPPVLHRVIWGNTSPPQALRDLIHIRPAILHGFQRHKVKHADYPAIIPAHDSFSVRGTLVTGLTDGDIWRLDIFEGYEYKRRKVTAKLLKQTNGKEEGMGDLLQKEEDNSEGEDMEAEVYVWVAGIKRLELEEWDFSEFVQEKMHRWAGREAEKADEGFKDVDDAVAALEDPTGGRGASGSITKELEQTNSSESCHPSR
ncbi:hypothetical protein EJ04DRAFT_517006 [Polyplosphaeria fusca]|uniref:Putative gamma-glutamylcyclotransferase n=1 Tax=Polyplosphaeria fusca TaxID=682080 RepID=A0A9P4QLF9_9PLEO|nr:hypothetical protein EJ04DRAFT_517006 [Polyplosphaeria fusca]